MTLDNFKTEGPRSYTPEGAKNSKQSSFGARSVDNFEDEWGLPQHEAANDLDFIGDRVKDAETITELCEMFSWLEHTVISKVAKAVEEGIISKQDVPNLTHPSYNEKETSFYIEQRMNNEDIGNSSFSETSTSSTSTSSSDESDDFSSGLGNFTS